MYFLATCFYLDPDIDLDIELKLRPHGELNWIDNSSLDHFFKNFKVFRLHAILHDACGFVYEYSEKRRGLSTALSGQLASNSRAYEEKRLPVRLAASLASLIQV